MNRFFVGAIVGGIVVWIWRDDIQHYLDRNARTVRSKVADTLQTVQHAAEEVLDRAKQQVSANLESSRDAIRPSPEFEHSSSDGR